MWEVSIDSLQQQVCMFRGEYWEVCIFLWGGGATTHASGLDRAPPWGLSVPASLILLLCRLLLCRRLLSLYGLMTLSLSSGSSAGEGEGVIVCTLLTLYPLPSCPRILSLPSGLCHPVPWPLGYVGNIVDLPGFGHYVDLPPALSL